MKFTVFHYGAYTVKDYGFALGVDHPDSITGAFLQGDEAALVRAELEELFFDHHKVFNSRAARFTATQLVDEILGEYIN